MPACSTHVWWCQRTACLNRMALGKLAVQRVLVITLVLRASALGNY